MTSNVDEFAAKTRARLISFYLPQFHPIPENDAWWGKGFTEWTNVSKSKSLFSGHHQPHLPTDLGFYDLRLPESRKAQADMAREHGIEAFCYWHYWFHGKRLIERHFEEVLSSKEPDFSFCLAWANETWSRRWLGEEKDILMPQAYSREDDLSHVRWLLPVFADPRCVKVNGRPMFLIYRPTDLPAPQRTTDLIRSECVRNGLPEPFLIGINSHCWDLDCSTIGFDRTLLFMPQLGNLPEFMNDEPSTTKLERNRRFGVDSDKLKIYDYEEALVSMLGNRSKYSHPVVPSIFVGWDNTPRRSENGIILVNSKPETFGKYLNQLVEEVQENDPDERLVFLNAWNEWAEGNHLEPDDLNGRSFLEEVKRVNDPLQSSASAPSSAREHTLPPSKESPRIKPPIEAVKIDKKPQNTLPLEQLATTSMLFSPEKWGEILAKAYPADKILTPEEQELLRDFSPKVLSAILPMVDQGIRDQFAAVLRNKDRQITDIHNSLSWKITAPLRKIFDLLFK